MGNEDMHYQASFDSVAPPRLSKTILQVGAALASGACLGLLAVSLPKLQSTNSAEFTSLVGGPTSLRHSPMTSIGQRAVLASLPGGSWKDVAERWHPIYGGAIDVPSVAAGKDARLL